MVNTLNSPVWRQPGRDANCFYSLKVCSDPEVMEWPLGLNSCHMWRIPHYRRREVMRELGTDQCSTAGSEQEEPGVKLQQQVLYLVALLV